MEATPPLALAESNGSYRIHRLNPGTASKDLLVRLLNESTSLFALLQSTDEVSIVCEDQVNVDSLQSNGPWRAFRVVGELDFALTGILASLTTPLAEAGIPVFAISSFDTDYLLVGAEQAYAARSTQHADGCGLSSALARGLATIALGDNPRCSAPA